MTRTIDQLKEQLQTLLANSEIKPGSKKAALVEASFLRGFIFADPDSNSHAWLMLCMISGRSILDP